MNYWILHIQTIHTNPLQFCVCTASEWGHMIQHSFLHTVKQYRRFSFTYYNLLFSFITAKLKMLTLSFTETWANLQTQCNFLSKQWWTPPSQTLMHEWCKKLMETRRLLWQTKFGHASTSPENVEWFQELLVHTPKNLCVGAAINSTYHAQQCTRC